MRHATVSRLVVCSLVALLLACAQRPAQGQTFTWNNPIGGTFGVGSNWTPAGPPSTTAQFAQFNLANTYTVSFAASTANGSLNFQNGTVTFLGAVAGRTYSLIGITNFTGGSLTISGMSLSGGDCQVQTGGRLTVSNTASLTSTRAMIGNSGIGVMNINGGTLLLGANTNFLALNGGQATLQLSNGATGTFQASTHLSDSSVSGSSGTLLVDSGADLTASHLRVGTRGLAGQIGFIGLSGGTSTLTQTGAATIDLGAASGSVGTISINSGTFSSGTGTITVNPTGFIDVGGGTFVVNGPMIVDGGTVRRTGSTSVIKLGSGVPVTVKNGGSLAFSDDMSLSAANTVTVVGPGSRLAVQGNRPLLIDNDSSLNVSGGGNATVGWLYLDIFGDGAGSALCDGSGSSITTTNAGVTSFVSSNFGNATMTFSNSATGNVAGAVGIGGGSGAGTLNVLSGSHLVTSSLVVAAFANSTFDAGAGTVNVAGPGSSMTISGSGSILLGGPDNFSGARIAVTDFAVFNSGTGAITVAGGGRISAATATFNANGNVIVEDFGQIIANAGTFQLAAGANLTVRGGGTVTLGPLPLAGGSVATIDGGTLHVSTISFGGGATIAFNSGTFGIGGGFLDDNLLTSVLGPPHTLNLGRAFTVDGFGQLGAPLVLDGGVFSVGDFSASPTRFHFLSGTYNLTASSLSIGSGVGELGNNVTLYPNMAVNITNNNLVSVASIGLLVLSGGSLSASGGIVNNGEIVMNSPSSVLSGGTLTNNKLLRGDGRISNTLANGALGTVRASAGQRLLFSGAGPTNAGTFQLLGGELEFTAPLTNAATGWISGQGSLFSGGLTNAGTVALSGGVSNVYGDVINNNKMNVTGGANATFWGAVTNAAGSEFKVNTASIATFFGAVSGLGAFTGPGTKIFESTAALGPLESAGSTRVEAGALLVADRVREVSLQISGGVTITSKPTGPGSATGTGRVQSLLIAGTPAAPEGVLDLTNNSFVVDYTASPGTLVNDTRQLLANGGIVSSSANAVMRLGYGDNASLNKPTFGGLVVDVTSLLIRFTYVGDSNLDGQVDVTDLGALATNWQTSSVWTGGDFNYDGFVDVTDLGALATNWQAGASSPSASDSFEQAMAAFGLNGVRVPEPTVVVAAGMLLLARRRGAAVQ